MSVNASWTTSLKHFDICSKVIKVSIVVFKSQYPFVYSVHACKDKSSKHQHGRMQRAQCQKDTNKKTSTYQRLKNQPLNCQHSLHFLAKIGLSKCRLAAKNSRGEQLRNMNEVYFKDSLDFASSLRACNLRRTMNLEKEGGGTTGREAS